MANRKLDMGHAWTQATAMIGANRETIGAIAGLFFFLPSLALALLAPELVNPPPPAPGGDPQLAAQAMFNQMALTYSANWPVLLGLSVVQFIGSLSLLALLTDRARPTVREALVKGISSILPYLAAQLLSGIAVALVIGVPLGILAVNAPPAVTVLAGFALVLAAVYLFIKFALVAPVIVIDGIRNPVAALARSWRLTKGNSFRIALFIVLLGLTIGIIATLVTAVVGLVFGAFGGTIAEIGNGLMSALVNAAVGVVFLVVIAAIHRQLTDGSAEALAATFE